MKKGFLRMMLRHVDIWQIGSPILLKYPPRPLKLDWFTMVYGRELNERKNEARGSFLGKDKTMGRNQYVVRYDDAWVVRAEGSDRVTSIHRTQHAAENVGRHIAKNLGTELFIQGRDGKFRDRDSFGNDPCPPRNRKH